MGAIYVPQQAIDLASRPQFDGLHDPNPRTALIEPYHDPVGFPTIGYGHLLSRVKWEPLDKYSAITKEEALTLLEKDLGRAARSVCGLIKVPLNDNQYAALIDFTFNCGGGNLEVSTLRRVINRGEFHKAPSEFMRWVYAQGVLMKGLVYRRKAESELWIETWRRK
ncbi:lysozyme [Pseudomonas asplenii]|uniref:lysozyme n=1 Tax=Pseudomonas asplenii TaxID=53407 RepID=UPI000367FBAE|nr:lysozyme [Pseudomonas fuscovaginae]